MVGNMSQEPYPGQAYFHEHNPNIAATEKRAEKPNGQIPIFNGPAPQSWYDRNYKSLMLVAMVIELLGLGVIALLEFLSYYFPRHP